MTFSIIMPVHNGASTLKEVLLSLEAQKNKDLVDEIIFIDDGSNDDSLTHLQEYVPKSHFKNRILIHEKAKGLAATYNDGIDACQSELFVLMHQDIILSDPMSLSKVIEPFYGQPTVVATYPVLLTPEYVWANYNFWMKCMFSRQIERKSSVFSGKFDCVIKSHLRFNSSLYRTGGEDGDFYFQLEQTGRIVPSNLEVIHIHNMHPSFSVFDLLRKECQFGEIYGVQLRRHIFYLVRAHRWTSFSSPSVLVRLLLLISICIPYLRWCGWLGIAFFCFFYTKTVYLNCFTNWRILFLPAVTFAGMVLQSLFLLKGFVIGKQKI